MIRVAFIDTLERVPLNFAPFHGNGQKSQKVVKSFAPQKILLFAAMNDQMVLIAGGADSKTNYK